MFDFAQTHARKTDPEVSFEAAARAVEFSGAHCDRILACLETFGPQTKDEIADKTGLSPVQVDRRLPDLRKAGKAVPTGDVRQSHSGRPERVWRAVQ
jgi:predicted ArsR family transcriptional regulator